MALAPEIQALSSEALGGESLFPHYDLFEIPNSIPPNKIGYLFKGFFHERI
jgi:hypothetical protein